VVSVKGNRESKQ